MRVMGSKTARNALWIMAGRLVNKLLVFLVGVVTARYLGPGNYGLINYAAAYLTFFAALCNLGIQSVIVKDFVDQPQEAGKAIGSTLVLRAASGLLSAVVMVGIVSVADREEPLTVLVAAVSSVSLVFRAGDTLKQWFHARLQSRYAAMATVLSYAVASVYKIVLLVRGMEVLWFALASTVEFLALCLFLLLAYRKQGGPKLEFSRKKAGQLLRLSSGFIVSGLMVSVYACTDQLMLKQMLDKEAVACYALSVALCGTWGFVLEAVIESVQPAILKAHGQSPALFRMRNRQLYVLVFYGALAMSLVVCLLAEPIVLLLYGEAYAPAVQPLRIVVWYTAFSYLGGARNAWVVCENAQKSLKYLYIGAAAINVALNLVLIPLWGTSGAALASLVTQISTTVFLPVLIPALRPNAKLMLEALVLKDTLPTKKG